MDGTRQSLSRWLAVSEELETGMQVTLMYQLHRTGFFIANRETYGRRGIEWKDISWLTQPPGKLKDHIGKTVRSC